MAAEPAPAEEPHHETFQKRFSNVPETFLERGETVYREREIAPPTEALSSTRSESQTNPPPSAPPPPPRGAARGVEDDDEPFDPGPDPDTPAAGPDPPEVAAVVRLADELFPAGGMAPFARRACLGGVKPAWVAEALARSAVGAIDLIDADDLCVSNTNRQLPAIAGQYGRNKAEVMKKHDLSKAQFYRIIGKREG